MEARRQMGAGALADRFRLDGRVAVITGASSGLGVTAAHTLGAAGARVVLAARREDRLREVEADLTADGVEATVVRCDVSDRQQCFDLVTAAREAFGSVDVLVNNAGVSSSAPATRESEAEFRRVIDINLMGAYWMAQACGALMQPGSSIVNVSSVLSMTSGGLPQAAYTASKAAINGLTHDLAQQWSGRRGIRVNAIAPGFFATEMTAEYADEYLAHIVNTRVTIGRLGEPDEFGDALLFLASPASSYITGVVLPVDGGVLLT